MASRTIQPAEGVSAPPAGRRTERRLGEILIEAGALDAAALAAALDRQRGSGQRLGQILVQEGLIEPAQLEEALARQWSIGRIDLGIAEPDRALLEGCDPAACLALPCIPWRRLGRTTVVAIADPARLAEAAAACGQGGASLAFALADAGAIRRALARGFRRELMARAIGRTPAPLSVRSWAQRGQRNGLLALGTIALTAALAGTDALLAGILAWAALWNGATAAMRLAALALSFRRPIEPPAEVARLNRFRTPPTVSILVPLYRETEVLDQLIAGLSRIDYPADRLDIILVVEEDDEPMLNALALRELPAFMRTLPVPAGNPRTKPRAMNYALDFARGEIIGIYDAEDQPDPGQVSAVVETFSQASLRVGCVQARLGYYNAGQNWLARCFAVEYATWFEVLLPGVQRLGLPVPLGGTSVFFRREVLEAVGAWDAHNVTEDADLGMRLARFGYRTEVIRSTTLEEANCHARAWIRQRSRWLKGYAATWITHMRRPGALWRDLGPVGFAGFQIILLGGITAYLALPFLWASWAWVALAGVPAWMAALPGPVLWGFWGTMLLGQATMIAAGLRALALTGQLRMAPALIVMPVYWPLGAVAAWLAVIELCLAPFRWHKTRHGISDSRHRPAAGAPGRAAGGAQRIAAASSRRRVS